jgi:hypothetical protein
MIPGRGETLLGGYPHRPLCFEDLCDDLTRNIADNNYDWVRDYDFGGTAMNFNS